MQPRGLYSFEFKICSFILLPPKRAAKSATLWLTVIWRAMLSNVLKESDKPFSNHQDRWTTFSKFFSCRFATENWCFVDQGYLKSVRDKKSLNQDMLQAWSLVVTPAFNKPWECLWYNRRSNHSVFLCTWFELWVRFRDYVSWSKRFNIQINNFSSA